MSTIHNTEPRTDTQPTRAPDTHQLAAELGVDGVLLRDFVDHHDAPTAPIVLGWVHSQGGNANPDRFTEDVELWLDAQKTRTPDLEPVKVEDLPISGPYPKGWGE